MSWKLHEEQEGDKYYYTVGVKGSPNHQQQHSSPQPSRKHKEKPLTDSESDLRQSDSQTRSVHLFLKYL